MNIVYLLTGGNVGNRQQYLENAALLIETACGKITRRSAVYETAAWGKTDQAAFLNQALELSTLLDPGELMKALLLIEQKTGRERSEKYGPRTIDIDILLFNSAIVQSVLVTIPHPQMANRRFVLVPMAEIAPAFRHPLLQKNISELLTNCADPLDVKKFYAASGV